MNFRTIEIVDTKTSLYSICKTLYNESPETMAILDFEYGDFKGYCSHMNDNIVIDIKGGEKISSLKLGRVLNVFIPVSNNSNSNTIENKPKPKQSPTNMN